MTDKEALKLALEALEYIDKADNDRDFLGPEECCDLDDAITAIKQALAAHQEHEPVAWIEHHKGGDNLEWDNPGGKCTPLYTTPPAAKRPWTGLTDDERDDFALLCGSYATVCAIEDTIKEKNI
jgi:hypothetical protein